jgi:hypothetical protein
MNAQPVLLALLLGASSLLQGEQAVIPELRIPDGFVGDRVLKNVRIMKMEPDGLRLSHDAGISKIPYEALPESLREKFKFDPIAASAYRTEQEAARREAARPMPQVEVGEPDLNVPPTELQPQAADLSQLNLVTMKDVKDKWLATLAVPLDPFAPDAAQQRDRRDEARRAILAGEYDLKAQKFAHEYNAWLYNQFGDKAAADRETAALMEIERIEATNRLADATARNATAQQQSGLQTGYLINPYPTTQTVYVPTVVHKIVKPQTRFPQSTNTFSVTETTVPPRTGFDTSPTSKPRSVVSQPRTSMNVDTPKPQRQIQQFKPDSTPPAKVQKQGVAPAGNRKKKPGDPTEP